MSVSELICARFSFSPLELRTYARTCPYRYKTYPIDKRNSDEKRWISQPSKDLKAVQRLVLSEFLMPKLIVHDAAKAYKAETNILDNAKPHLKNQFLLKMDFRNFFPSIKSDDFVTYLLEKGIVHNDVEAGLLGEIFFKHEDGEFVLSIGSPGSPIISNALMFSFDKEISDICGKEEVAYTRYSDDISFSTNRRDLLFTWPAKVEAVVAGLRGLRLEVTHQRLQLDTATMR
ncbi:MAG: reverse transcriptase domain-containing protein [Sulfitobacter sp.]|jgi:RNA-directed DNA polymerase